MYRFIKKVWKVKVKLFRIFGPFFFLVVKVKDWDLNPL
jgi:hypothetical protein